MDLSYDVKAWPPSFNNRSSTYTSLMASPHTAKSCIRISARNEGRRSQPDAL
ncbi:MAG: hypothetical protein OEW30_15760 [Acidimicrobiia bacterium]|nr:hypothetical protein [Acidimicrobiia bacterium]